MRIFKTVLKAAFPTLLAAILSVSCSILNPEPAPTPTPEEPENPENPQEPEPPGSSLGSEFSETTSMRGLDYESPADTIKMHDNSLFLRNDINRHLISYNEKDAVITFENCEDVKKAGIKVGDVLYSEIIEGKAPNGYLLTVKEITTADDRIVFRCADAAMSDAFDRLRIPIKYELNKISEDDFTVYDIFNQPDLSEYYNPSQHPTRSFDVPGVDFDKDFAKLKSDWVTIKPSWTATTIDMVALDNDEDPKTTNDQLVISIRIQHDLGLTGDDIFDFGSVPYLWVSLESKMRFGATITVKFLDWEAEYDAEGSKNKELIDKMEKKLLGKKLLLAKWDIPVSTAVSTVLKPSIEFYVTFHIGINGKLEVTFGLEDYGFDYKIGNKPFKPGVSGSSFQDLDGSNYFRCGGEGHPVFDLKLEGDLKGSCGAGIGFSFGLPKITSVLLESDIPPYIGLFFEYSKVMDLKFSAKIDRFSSLSGNIKGECYNQTEGRCEAYVQFKDDWLWNPSFTIDAMADKWPTPPEFLDKSFEIKVERPVPYLIYPENWSVVKDMEINLAWTLPPMPSGLPQRHYQDITFDVYVSTDRAQVEKLAERCRIVTGQKDGSEDSRSCMFEPNFSGKYHWRVVSHNSLGEEYKSPIYSFDTDSGGTLSLNPELTTYLKMNREMLDGIEVSPEGTIELTISNQRALREMKSLTITDEQGLYGIKSIDDLLMHLPSLEFIECNNNSITSLNLTRNPKVKMLDCSNNNISDLTFAANNALETLVCKSNRLRALDIIKNLPHLTTLSCSDNQELYTLNWSWAHEQSALENLTANDCALTHMDNDFTQMPRLKTLFASNNNLWAIDVSKCRNLQRVNLSGQSTTQMRVFITRAIKAQLIDPKFHYDTVFVFDDPGGEGSLDDVPGEKL